MTTKDRDGVPPNSAHTVDGAPSKLSHVSAVALVFLKIAAAVAGFRLAGYLLGWDVVAVLLAIACVVLVVRINDLRHRRDA